MTDRNRDPHPDSPPDADHDRRADMQQIDQKSAPVDDDEPPVFVEPSEGSGVGTSGGRGERRGDTEE